ncbi:Imm42 family immunity protein [Flavobacterium oreochromis]|uniref:Imm42 family immunity protein n=1 Tax=Flavobacterium oreochromis TaxID=2906078 RepID=A0ABW8PBX2_9FLAO|nr:hypothetical protein BWK58_09975 [Flavobacterium columnare]
MNYKSETYFGDKNNFAIRYVQGHTDKSKNYFYASCHLVLNGQIIGDIDEICFLNSWKTSVQDFKERIKNDFDLLWHPEFNNRTDTEIFELILKANQLKEEYNPQFAHLPVLENEIWSNCHISLDETTDAFLIAMIKQNEQIKFLWKEWREPCPNEKIDKLNSIVLDKQFVIEVIEKCLNTITEDCLNYPMV